MKWIPRYIKQTSAKRPGQVVTAEDWNELFNLVIGQGDYTAEGLLTAITSFSKSLKNKADLVGGVIPIEQMPAVFKPGGFENLVTTVDQLVKDVPANNTTLNKRCDDIENTLYIRMIGGI